MVYGLTLPERTVRSAAALISGAAGESVALIVPRSFQDSKSYRVFVQQMLDMVSHDVGGVKKETPETDDCLLYTSPSPRDRQKSRMPSSA